MIRAQGQCSGIGEADLSRRIDGKGSCAAAFQAGVTTENFPARQAATTGQAGIRLGDQSPYRIRGLNKTRIDSDPGSIGIRDRELMLTRVKNLSAIGVY